MRILSGKVSLNAIQQLAAKDHVFLLGVRETEDSPLAQSAERRGTRVVRFVETTDWDFPAVINSETRASRVVTADPFMPQPHRVGDHTLYHNGLKATKRQERFFELRLLDDARKCAAGSSKLAKEMIRSFRVLSSLIRGCRHVFNREAEPSVLDMVNILHEKSGTLVVRRRRTSKTTEGTFHPALSKRGVLEVRTACSLINLLSASKADGGAVSPCSALVAGVRVASLVGVHVSQDGTWIKMVDHVGRASSGLLPGVGYLDRQTLKLVEY
jgi:hypothetical protein